MSLKAKIEAVIYAAEEPVTLAQLVGLLGQEAEAELDRIASAQRSLDLGPDSDEPPPPSEPDLLNDEILLMEEALADEEADESAEVEAGGEADAPPLDLPVLTRPDQTEQAEQTEQPEQADVASAAAVASPARDQKQVAREERERARDLRDYLRQLLDELIRDYSTSDRGLEIREVAGGYRLATKPEYHDAVRGFVRSLKPPLKLTLQALETLAVIAYKQPVTAPEISEIRGVDSAGVLGSLMARKLITTAGRKQVIGRPILYKTTRDFLLRFGLKDIGELPSIEEFEKMAGELAEPQEEFQMPPETPHTDPELARSGSDVESVTGANLEEERESTEPQADGDSSDPATEAAPVDGRISGLPIGTQTSSDNPSAQDAAVQSSGRNDGIE